MFFSKFYDMKKQALENLKTTQNLKQVNMEEFLAKNQPTPGDVYSAMCLDGCLSRYPSTMKWFKFALLISPTTSEVERGFSTMNLLVSPLHTSLNDANVDRLMRICIDGPTNFSDNELEQMVDIFHDSNDRRIVLWRLLRSCFHCFFHNVYIFWKEKLLNHILFLLSYLDLYFMLDHSSEELTFSLILTCDYEDLNQIYLKNEHLFS